MTATSTTAAAEAHVADGKQRRRRGWRTFWLFFAGFCLLLLLLPCVAYIAWQAHGRHLLQEQVDLIQQRGEPLTTAEMEAWYAVPKGERDITEIWLAAIEPFDTAEYNEAVAHIPLADLDRFGALSISQLKPDAETLKKYLKDYKQELANLQAAAKEHGAICYPRKFDEGINMRNKEVSKVRSASRALQLQLQQHVRDENFDAALRNIETQLALGNTLQREPLAVSLCTRLAVFHGTLSGIRQLAERLSLDDTQIYQLQSHVQKMQIQDQLEFAGLGERGVVYHSFHLPLYKEAGIYEVKTTRDISRIERLEDCAMSLNLCTQYLDAFNQGPTTSLDAVYAVNKQLKALDVPSPWLRERYAQTYLMVSSLGSLAHVHASFCAHRDLTDTLLAIRRFELKHQSKPQNLFELTPDFLPVGIVDPFNGQPLKFHSHSDSGVIYSVGGNGIDNGGVMDEARTEPDIVLKIRFESQ